MHNIHSSISKIIYSDGAGIITNRQDKCGDNTGEDEQQAQWNIDKEDQQLRCQQQEQFCQTVD